MDLESLSQFALKHASHHGADQAEVSVDEERGFSVSARDGAVENLEHNSQKSFSVTVYKDQCAGSTTTTRLSERAIASAVDKALSIASFGEPDPAAGLADPERLAKAIPDLDLHHSWSLSPEDAVDKAIACDEQVRARDARFTTAESSYVESHEYRHLYANSLGFMGSFPSTRHSMSCSVLAKSGNDMQRGGEYTLSRDPDQLCSIDALTARAAEETLARLDARHLSTRECAVVFRADVAKSLFGHFISAISGGALYRKTSFLLDAMDQRLFPAWMDIRQSPHLKGGLGSMPFDGEGVATEDRAYIEAGVLKSYVLGSYSARRLGLASTGNAGGVFNLSVSHSDIALKGVLEEMGEGLLVTELLGQGVNLVTGEYSRGAFGFWVENGEIQYPVQEITLAGNLKDFYQSLRVIGNDVDARGNIRTGSVLIDKVMVAGH